MSTTGIVLLVIAGVLLVALIVLGIFGNKKQKEADAAKEQMKASAQVCSMLVIDKKRMKMREAGFPSIVLDQTPKYMQGMKVPVVKAQVNTPQGRKVLSLMCDEKVFDIIPVKKEVKAELSGIYIMGVKGLRGGLEAAPEKKGFFAKQRAKLIKKRDQLAEETKATKEAQKAKKAK